MICFGKVEETTEEDVTVKYYNGGYSNFKQEDFDKYPLVGNRVQLRGNKVYLMDWRDYCKMYSDGDITEYEFAWTIFLCLDESNVVEFWSNAPHDCRILMGKKLISAPVTDYDWSQLLSSRSKEEFAFIRDGIERTRHYFAKEVMSKMISREEYYQRVKQPFVI